MEHDRPVVVGVDGSLPSYAAVDWGVYEAQRRRVPLRLVHAVEPVGDGSSPAAAGGAPDEITSAAAGYAYACADDVEVVTEALCGEPVSRLVDESAGAAVVVVGNRGPGGLRSLLGGSVGARTAAHARCPVVVVRPCHAPAPGDLDPHHGVGRVVVGVDASPLSQAALAFAFEEAALRGIGLAAVHAWRYPVSVSTGDVLFAGYERLELAVDERQLLTAALAPFRARFPEVPVQSVAVQAVSPAAALIHESGGARLLVVGSYGRGGLAALLLGSVSRAAIHHACCPVAVIHR
jgi:nucleotide-binding universal stress UspA family protein